jgi:hypothetical protein
MGKGWDSTGIANNPALWSEVLRVLKPGGHCVAFSGTRTYHRMACAIEDAGFEIRDQLAWTYGSGFPKSLDVSKAIDKAAGAEREVVGFVRAGISQRSRDGDMVGGLAIEAMKQSPVSAPATDAARQWEGWGTALKPAWEPICLARKPLSEKTVAANVLRWGTGAINADATRIPTEDKLGVGMVSMGRPKVADGWDRPWMHDPEVTERKKVESAAKVAQAESLGRFPANLCHDGSQEVLDLFPESKAGVQTKPLGTGGIWSDESNNPCGPQYGDSGSAARFFYCAKASKSDRANSKHPTVKPIKPIKLMQWLCRMVTPPGGVVLDPFAGSGTTGAAAILEGFKPILIEREDEYVADIRARFKDMELEAA